MLRNYIVGIYAYFMSSVCFFTGFWLSLLLIVAWYKCSSSLSLSNFLLLDKEIACASVSLSLSDLLFFWVELQHYDFCNILKSMMLSPFSCLIFSRIALETFCFFLLCLISFKYVICREPGPMVSLCQFSFQWLA